jgi:hypothetical protein
LDGATGDSVILLELVQIGSQIAQAKGNTLNVGIGGWSQDFNVDNPGSALSKDGSTRVSFKTMKRKGATIAHVLTSGKGALKAALFAGQTLNASGNPAALPVRLTLNGFFAGGYCPASFKMQRGIDKGKFGLK